MKVFKVKLRVGESLTINGYGEVSENRLFDYKYSKDDTIGIIIDGNVYDEVSTAFDFVEVKLPSAKQMYALIESLVNNVQQYKNYDRQLLQMAELVTNIEY